MMTLERISHLLGSSLASEITHHWQKSMRSLPPEGPYWLEEERIVNNAQYAGFGDDAIQDILRTVRRIREHPESQALAWHLYQLAFHDNDTTPALFKYFPRFDTVEGCFWGQFYLVISLPSVDLARKLAEKTGVTDQIIRDTMQDIYLQSERFRLSHNYLGLNPESLNWLRHHALGQIFRLGRLQFMVKPFGLEYRIYRHRQSGCTVALAGDGVCFDADGFVCAKEVDPDWSSTLNLGDDWIEGFPILPEGKAQKRLIRLDANEWECRIEKHTPVLDMHIPAGGGMTLTACQESMRQALTFFPEHFPERKFAAFACKSWIFNTQLQEVLPPTANLVQFQRAVYLLPTMSDGKAGLNFIFGTKDIDLSAAPRQTSIQRALLEILESGQTLRSGGMIFLPEDIDHIGSQFYRMRWNEALANCVGVQV